MGYVAPAVVMSIGAVVAGIVMIVAGFRARPARRDREGAQIVAGFLACLGLLIAVAGALYLASSV